MKPNRSTQSVSRRRIFALAAGAPAFAVAPALAQSTADQELEAAEARMKAAIEELRRFPLPPDAEPAMFFKA